MLDRFRTGNNSGGSTQSTTLLADTIAHFADKYKLNEQEYRDFITVIETQFVEVWEDLSPSVGANTDSFMDALVLSMLGTAIPEFTNPSSQWYSPEIVKSATMVNSLDKARAQQRQPQRSSKHLSNVGVARNVQQSHSRGGGAYSTHGSRRGENRKSSNLTQDEDMFDKKHYHGTVGLPHTSVPLKQTPGGTKPVPNVIVRRVAVPVVSDRSEEFEKNDNSNIDQLTHEPSVVSYQLDTANDLLNSDTPCLYKWWVEEHMVYGKNTATPESDERITSIFNSFAEIDNYDTLIDLIRELGALGKSEVIMWLSNRITDEILQFIQRNYECSENLVCTHYLRKPEESLAELGTFGIKDIVVSQILFIFRKLFKDWAFLVLRPVDTVVSELAELNAESGIGSAKKHSVTTTVILRYPKSILTIPIIALYYKHGVAELEINDKSLYVLNANPVVKTDAIDALIQNVFSKIDHPYDHELLIMDKTLTLYRTFKLRDEPPTEVFYEIERLTL
jgi:hypothetical protein